MQQRQLRLGDILDDYCPRERRVTNHVIVAMIEQQVKQTRCVTCDAEHEYKRAKVPPQRKKKEAGSALYGQVLAGVVKKGGLPAVEASAAAVQASGNGGESGSSSEASPEQTTEPGSPIEGAAPVAVGEEEGPVHRPLIRATLPRTDGQVPARPVPEFTVRQANTRGRFRPNGGRNQQRSNRPHGQPPAHGLGGGTRFGQPSGPDHRGGSPSHRTSQHPLHQQRSSRFSQGPAARGKKRSK